MVEFVNITEVCPSFEIVQNMSDSQEYSGASPGARRSFQKYPRPRRTYLLRWSGLLHSEFVQVYDALTEAMDADVLAGFQLEDGGAFVVGKVVSPIRHDDRANNYGITAEIVAMPGVAAQQITA